MDDGNPCTLEACAGPSPIHIPAPDGTVCPSGVCMGGVCTFSCFDGLRNGTETDVDCGGATCPKCAFGKRCAAGVDCVTGVCVMGICQ
jgi:hypothetical protein